MSVRFNGKLTSLRDCNVGDLVRLAIHGAAALAIVLSKDEGQGTCWLAVIQYSGESFQAPVHLHEANSAKCISFGGAWVLELLPEGLSFPGDSRFLETPGVLHIEDDAVSCFFAAGDYDPTKRHGASFCLKSFRKRGTIDAHSVPCTSWKIWVNESERDDPRGTPIFELTH